MVKDGRYGHFDHFNSRPCGRGDTSSTRSRSARTPHFNSRPCGRGDSPAPRPSPPCTQFQFTPLREGRLRRRATRRPSVLFQFTPLREGRRTIRRRVKLLSLISIHAPAGGATYGFKILSSVRYFNSRPCGRGDCENDLLRGCCCISIHAPAGGATGDLEGVVSQDIISIHAPAGGAT